MRKWIIAFLLLLSPAMAQTPPAQPNLSPADQQLAADWQSLNTALLHVQQDLAEKIKADADLKTQMDALKRENDALKAKH